MKKFLTYFLSAVMLVGLFGPLAAQAAVQPLGNAQTQYDSLAQNGAPTNLGQSDTNTSNDIGCLATNAGASGGMQVAICVSQFVYYATVGLGSWAATITAYVFDYATYLSLSSAAYAMDFVALGWGIVRDAANMAFLFILLYIGYTVMLRADTVGTTRMLVGVITVALLVNFSFLMTRVVIDAGNIAAVQFYNAIISGNTNIINNPASSGTAGNVGVRDLTASIMNALNVQSLISTSNFKNFIQDKNNSPMYYLIVSSVTYILIGFSLLMLAATFIFVGVKFILRIVALWGLIILSPAAFVSAIFNYNTGSKAIGGWGRGFNLWFGFLIKFSFYPAIFLFLFYIQTRFVQEMGTASLFNNILNTTSNTTAWEAIVQSMANVGVRLGFIMSTLYVTLHAADWVVKEGSGWAGKVEGWTRGALVGGLRYGSRELWHETKNWGQVFRPATQSMSNAATRSGVNSTLWRGLNRVVGGKNIDRDTARKQIRENPPLLQRRREERERLAKIAKEERERAEARAKAEQEIAQRREGAQQQIQPQNQQGGAQQGRAQAVQNRPPDTTAAANANQPFRARPNQGVQAGQPVFVPAAQRGGAAINPPSQWGVVNGEPAINPRAQWRAPTIAGNISAQRAIEDINKQAEQNRKAVQAGAVSLTLAREPDMSSSPTVREAAVSTTTPITQDAGELKEAIRGLREATGEFAAAVKNGSAMPERVTMHTTTPVQQVTYTAPAPLRPTSTQVSTDLNDDSLNKIASRLAKKIGPKLQSYVPEQPPPSASPPAAARPTSQQKPPEDYPYSQAAE